MLRNAMLLLIAVLAAECHASASLQISNEHGDCHLNTVSLDDGRSAFNTSCPIADVDTLQKTLETVQTELAALRAQVEFMQPLVAQLISPPGSPPSLDPARVHLGHVEGACLETDAFVMVPPSTCPHAAPPRRLRCRTCWT